MKLLSLLIALVFAFQAQASEQIFIKVGDAKVRKSNLAFPPLNLNATFLSAFCGLF